jgi:cytochrome c oxidase subunit 4
MADHPSETGHAHEPGHGEHDGHAGHGGLGKYLLVFLALCVLTGASFMTYSEWWRDHFSAHTGWALMMAVSCTKALLVMLFFMHLLWEANWKYVLTIPAAMMSLFLALMLVPDIGLRTWWYTPERWLHAAQPEEHHEYDGKHGGGHEDPHKNGHSRDGDPSRAGDRDDRTHPGGPNPAPDPAGSPPPHGAANQ